MESLIEKFMDNAMSIGILALWVIKEQKEKGAVWERFNSCLDRFESHLENHEDMK